MDLSSVCRFWILWNIGTLLSERSKMFELVDDPHVSFECILVRIELEDEGSSESGIGVLPSLKVPAIAFFWGSFPLNASPISTLFGPRKPPFSPPPSVLKLARVGTKVCVAYYCDLLVPFFVLGRVHGRFFY